MLESLVAEMAASLDGADAPLRSAAEVVRRRLAVDRASISEIDRTTSSFEILASAGAGLLVAGTRLPLSTSTHFLRAAECDPWSAPSFASLPDFDRPLDAVVVAAGYRSGCAVPIVRGDEVVGAIALSSYDVGVDYADRRQALTAVSGMLAVAMASEAHEEPTVLVCHGDALAAFGIARLLEASSRGRVLVCATVDDALAALAVTAPDVVVCDDHVDGIRVDELVARLRAGGAGAPVLVVATHDTPQNLAAAVNAGAAAYIRRAQASSALPLALATLRDGRTLLPPSAGTVLVAAQGLTARERQVIGDLDEGLRIKQIALRHGISEATAKCHTRNVFRKLGASSRAEAVREARRQGLLG